MQTKDSLALAVLLTGVLCFLLHTHAGGASVQYDPHQLRAAEKRLRDYLSKRVLVFRKGKSANMTSNLTREATPQLRAVRGPFRLRMRYCSVTSRLAASVS
jgi:hypothetical protein